MRLYSKIVTIVIILFFVYNQGVNAQGFVNDIDGNVYPTVVIGAQEWLGENLKVTRYKNGEPILTDQTADQWRVATEGIWTYYEGDPSNNDKYGKLYNWHATVDPRGLCPDGWRVPTDNDWQILTDFINSDAWGNFNTLGANLKSRRQVNSPLGGEFNTSEHPRWDSHPKIYGVDAYGFGALPGGGYTMGKAFVHLGQYAYFWSTTERENGQVWVRALMNSNTGMSRGQYLKNLGKSVRCVKGATQNLQVPQLITLPLTSITTTSAKSGGDVLSDGGSSVTGRGLVWGTSANPTIDDYLGILPSGSGLGVFNETISGLDPGAVYWVRAYATNEVGTAYGTQKMINTILEVGPPTLTTRAVSNITDTSAISGGVIGSDGGDFVTARGVVWSTAQNPTLDNNVGFTMDGEGSGTFYSSIAELEPATSYYLRAYATNSMGTSYGVQLSFSTLGSKNFIVVSDSQGEAGSEITIEVEMINQGDIMAFQMDFELPDGYTYVEGSYNLSDRSQGHTPGQSILADGKLRVLAYSSVNNVFLGNTGVLFTFKLNSPAQIGTWNIEATNVILTNTDFENVFDGAESGTISLYETTASWTPCPDMPTFTDTRDGNTYNTVLIGNQCWMRDNLAWLPSVYPSSDGSYFGPRYYVYDYQGDDLEEARQTDNYNNYGVLYNWLAANEACPSGWHLPSHNEWVDLERTICSSETCETDFVYDVPSWGAPPPRGTNEGAKLKSCRQLNHPSGGNCDTAEHPRWDANETYYGLDEFGFYALPAGIRDRNDAVFRLIGSGSYWWTSHQEGGGNAWYRGFESGTDMLNNRYYYKEAGLSVRCIKD